MSTVYFSLGTNLGDKKKNLCEAVKMINKRVGKVTSQSAFYKTTPWGFISENSFLNAAIIAETKLTPLEVLHQTKVIEKEMGRKQKSEQGSYSDRIIDIDILLYDNSVVDIQGLILPHPLMTERNFVMVPLVEIAPDVIHPVLKKKLKDLLASPQSSPEERG